MGSWTSLRLVVTRWGGASAEAVSRMRLPSHSPHAQASSTAACLRVNRHCSTSRYCRPASLSLTLSRAIIQRHFSLTPRRPSSSANEHGTPTPPRIRTKRTLLRYASYFVFCVLFSGASYYYTDKGRRDRCLLNPERFIKTKVISNEPVSPTAFILTVETLSSGFMHGADTPENYTVVRDACRRGLWSVEIKQPQLQIARHYTPLPPSLVEEHQSIEQKQTHDTVRLRFLVRRYDGGEVSTYLSRLRPDDEVEIRGPHLGFDVGTRLGSAGQRVVFLAGGTGIAPALQAASYLLDKHDASVQILWANRAAADCAGCSRAVQQQGWLWKGRGAVQEHSEEPGPIMRQLRELQAAYESRARTLKVRCAVDEEGGAFQARDIAGAVGPPHEVSGRTSTACYFHSQKQLVHSMEEDSHESRCACVDVRSTGNNLFVISGPDGFVSKYAGPKVWADGAQRQGPVGGILAELSRKDSAAWRDWLVLKQ